jgi:hypothetical protein
VNILRNYSNGSVTLSPLTQVTDSPTLRKRKKLNKLKELVQSQPSKEHQNQFVNYAKEHINEEFNAILKGYFEKYTPIALPDLNTEYAGFQDDGKHLVIVDRIEGEMMIVESVIVCRSTDEIIDWVDEIVLGLPNIENIREPHRSDIAEDLAHAILYGYSVQLGIIPVEPNATHKLKPEDAKVKELITLLDKYFPYKDFEKLFPIAACPFHNGAQHVFQMKKLDHGILDTRKQ